MLLGGLVALHSWTRKLRMLEHGAAHQANRRTHRGVCQFYFLERDGAVDVHCRTRLTSVIRIAVGGVGFKTQNPAAGFLW